MNGPEGEQPEDDRSERAPEAGGSGNQTFDRDHPEGAEDEVPGDRHGSAHHRKDTPEGEVRTQRGRPEELDPERVRLGREPSDADPRLVAAALGGVAALLVLGGTAVALLLGGLERLEPGPVTTRLEQTPLVPPAPRLERQEGDSLRVVEAAARERLARYGPAPGEPGRVRIPIDRAMELLAGHGWPDPDDGSRPAPRPAAAVPAEAVLPSTVRGGAP